MLRSTRTVMLGAYPPRPSLWPGPPPWRRPCSSCAVLRTPTMRRPKAAERRSGADVGEALGLVGGDAALDDGAEGAVHHVVEVVRLVARAVVGDAVLGEVVGADALRAVH